MAIANEMNGNSLYATSYCHSSHILGLVICKRLLALMGGHMAIAYEINGNCLCDELNELMRMQWQ